MGKDIYKKFKPLKIKDFWAIVTDDENEIIIAKIPSYLRHPKGVATALSSALSSSKFALTDLV